MESFDFESPQSFHLLCAHLYYQCLVLAPSLVRSWISESKNRKLVFAVEKYL
jgi:hypothetical protein